MFSAFIKRVSVAIMAMFVLSNTGYAQTYDQNIHYFMEGKGVGGWTPSLSFGKVKLEGLSGETIRASLVASPAKKENEADAINLKWTPRGVKNQWGSIDTNVFNFRLGNNQKQIDVAPVLKQAALVFDIKVLSPPKELVDLTMQCAWDWKCRTSVPIKNVLRKLPKKKWLTIPIPLQCFDDGKFDFSKVTDIFMLSTEGKMEIEIANIRLSAYPQDKVNCG